jgi:hypothetical protein
VGLRLIPYISDARVVTELCRPHKLTATSFGVGLPAAALSGATAAAEEAMDVASAAVAGACFALLTALLLVAATAALGLLPGDLCFAAAALSSAGDPAATSAADPAF